MPVQHHQQLLLMLSLLFYLMILTSLHTHLNDCLLCIYLCTYTFLINYSSITTIFNVIYHYNHVNVHFKRLSSTAHFQRLLARQEIINRDKKNKEEENWHNGITHVTHITHFTHHCSILMTFFSSSSTSHQHQHAHVVHVTVDLNDDPVTGIV